MPPTDHSKQRTPLRRISHGSLSNLARSQNQNPASNDPTRLNFLIPAFADLADEMASLHTNTENLNKLSQVLETFNESFATEEAQQALATLSLQPPSEPSLPDDNNPDATYMTADNTIQATAIKLPSKSALKNPNPAGGSKIPGAPVVKPKMTIKDRKAREELRKVMEGVIGSLMDSEGGKRIVDIVKAPLLPQAKVNKCLIALVNRKVVEKDTNKCRKVFGINTINSISELRSRRRQVPHSRLKERSSSYSTSQWGATHDARSRSSINGPVLTTLLAIGILGIGYGIYDMYSTFNTWPKEIRQDLRVAVRAKHTGDYRTSAAYFQKAYGTAISLSDPVASLGQDHIMKINAISLSLADALENYDLPAAYSVYETALADLRSDAMGTSERARAVGIAIKLGDIGERLLKLQAINPSKAAQYGPEDDAEVEEYYNWAVTTILKAANPTALAKPDEVKGDKETPPTEQLVLQNFVDGVELTSVMEIVADYYRRRGRPDYAAPLYLHAISTLLPVTGAKPEGNLFQFGTQGPSVRDRCIAATLMNNLASLLASTGMTNLNQGKAWAEKGRQIAQKAADELSPRPSDRDQRAECETALAVISFNLGMLNELSKDSDLAYQNYEEALRRSQAIGMIEGVHEARDAIKRLKSSSAKPNSNDRG
ncbi:hypothetical protein FRB98_008584 [Tulasnella sp. 332]|nr:hypothetical protein FRB98_008584 [Tulasnella sp. 332]